VQFERRNLIEPFPQRRFHFIFCRNVMIYFNAATQQQIVSRLPACLEPGGYLFIGHAESLGGTHRGLDYVQPAVYRNSATK
jgi:chemotaxis protein methyltransferase CheR